MTPSYEKSNTGLTGGVPLKLCSGSGGAQQASDLGHEHVLIARFGAQDRAEPALGQAASVERRRIEKTNAGFPRGLHCAVRLIVRHRFEETAQRRRAQTERGDLQAGAAEVDSLQSSQILSMRSLPSPLKSCVLSIKAAISASHFMLVGSFAISATARS
jgi:hypothetical protein